MSVKTSRSIVLGLVVFLFAASAAAQTKIPARVIRAQPLANLLNQVAQNVRGMPDKSLVLSFRRKDRLARLVVVPGHPLPVQVLSGSGHRWIVDHAMSRVSPYHAIGLKKQFSGLRSFKRFAARMQRKFGKPSNVK
jgi:hypothetical protein